MNILITNDDGIQAEGIKILAEKLRKAGHCVYMIAPAGNRSAISSKISIFNDLKLVKYDEKKWACEGSPADCVIIGVLGGLIPVKIDAVVSGINAGGNSGTDIVYSGTCAAARQAALYHLPGIAFSVENFDRSKPAPFYYETLVDFAVKNIEKLVSLAVTETPGGFVNVNAPSKKDVKGVRFCNELSIWNYNDAFLISPVEEKFGDGKIFVSKFDGEIAETVGSPLSDFKSLEEGYITVSVIQAEPYALKVEKPLNFVL